MGWEASYQAIPEDCELLRRARSSREYAEAMQAFHTFATDPAYANYVNYANEPEGEIVLAVQALVREKPGLIRRYFYAGARAYDAVHYLLSPERRVANWDNDHSLIFQAIYGSELLHPEARSGQGFPIGFIPSDTVATIAGFFAEITREQLHEHYDPPRMAQAGVYKIFKDDGEKRFQVIWEEFAGMTNVYQQAAAHGEAMITVID